MAERLLLERVELLGGKNKPYKGKARRGGSRLKTSKTKVVEHKKLGPESGLSFCYGVDLTEIQTSGSCKK
jgi:hypothetical protein